VETTGTGRRDGRSARAGVALDLTNDDDIAEAIEHASRAALAGGPLYDRFDGVIRAWPAATLALLLTAIAFGAALIGS